MICTIVLQSVLGAPGERIDLNLGALDQSGNWQAAVWSLAESDDYGKDKEVIEYIHTKNLIDCEGFM